MVLALYRKNIGSYSQARRDIRDGNLRPSQQISRSAETDSMRSSIDIPASTENQFGSRRMLFACL
ncbi:MAG: hypothetical protein CM1200mP26_02730 [Acidimicrobiales bacterium]|nr:MAG: hypothetical protein CM1200mP26_02730 [Acidimicrobiales bacterium]